MLVELEKRLPQPEHAEMIQRIRRTVKDKVGLVIGSVEIAPPGSVPLTTSGKVRRAAARDVFLDLKRGGGGRVAVDRRDL